MARMQISGTELCNLSDRLNTAQSLLSRLAQRCDDAACDLTDMRFVDSVNQDNDTLKEINAFLFEMGSTLQLVSESVETANDVLSRIDRAAKLKLAA